MKIIEWHGMVTVLEWPESSDSITSWKSAPVPSCHICVRCALRENITSSSGVRQVKFDTAKIRWMMSFEDGNISSSIEVGSWLREHLWEYIHFRSNHVWPATFIGRFGSAFQTVWGLQWGRLPSKMWSLEYFVKGLEIRNPCVAGLRHLRSHGGIQCLGLVWYSILRDSESVALSNHLHCLRHDLHCLQLNVHSSVVDAVEVLSLMG